MYSAFHSPLIDRNPFDRIMSAVADFELESLIHSRHVAHPPLLFFSSPRYLSRLFSHTSSIHLSISFLKHRIVMPVTRSSRAVVSPEGLPSYHDPIGMAVQATTFDMNKIGPDTKDTDIPWRLIKDLTNHFVSICPTLDTSGPEPSKYTITAHLRLGDDHNELQCGLKIDEWSKRAGPDGVVSIIQRDNS